MLLSVYCNHWCGYGLGGIRIILASQIRINDDADPDSGSKKSAKIMGNSHKKQQKLSEYNIFEEKKYTFV